MLKPIRWSAFPQDFLRLQIGYLMFGFSIALMIRGRLGTGAWAVLEVALSRILGVTPGTMTVAMGFLVLFIALALREKVGWATLGNIISIGPWEDLALWLIPDVQYTLPLQIAMLLTSILTMGMATAIYIGVDAGAGPRDSLMLALKRATGMSIRLTRGVIEASVVTLGWLLGGPVGAGTLVFALLIGPAVQWGFKVFNVHPHGPEAEIPQAPED